ncbi:luciferin 4-monooxygenase-like isoform X1 [Rhynchophorus ferrugineus]|uniref:luciferin 4-monooxygenase-like isoform X1 n=1 Tax=Rhynchophorus ferrugineus TaxID=354439 RepID=UPI003FCD72C1
MEQLPDEVILDESNVLSGEIRRIGKKRCIGSEYFSSMKKNKHRVAQYIFDTGETDTYEELLQRCVRTALHLQQRNLNPDDVVCLSSYNHRDSCVPFIASTFLGLKVASLDPSFTSTDAAYLLKMVKPKIMFIVPEIIGIISRALEEAALETELVIYGDDVDKSIHTAFTDFLEHHQDEEAFTPVEIDDICETAVIFFSSGTTGLPKGICVNHKALYSQGCLIHRYGLLHKDSVFLSFPTLYWISTVFHMTSIILVGCARLIVKKFDADQIWYQIDKYKVTYAFLAPFHAYQMIAVGRPDNIDTSSLSVVITGGAIFYADKIFELRELLPGTFICQAFGLTEVGGVALAFNIVRTRDRLLLYNNPSSCGRPMPGFLYKVVNLENERTCRANEKGELRIYSEFLLNGYYRQDSSEVFDGDGWLCTGDIVYYDEDACFYIVGRIKEMLKYQSWHVPPAVLEDVIQEHPAVKQVVVVGIPHQTDGEHPLALVVLKDQYKNTDPSRDIEHFVAKRVNDTHKLRGGVKFVESFPLTPSGKIKRAYMKEMVLNGEIQ